jgi:hypothetical protein
MMALYDGTVQDRYNRDLLQLTDDRKVRGFDYMAAERQDREYVDPDAVVVDGDGTVHGTVTSTGDNDPAGFDQSAFEADLAYNPNA